MLVKRLLLAFQNLKLADRLSCLHRKHVSRQQIRPDRHGTTEGIVGGK